MTAITGFVSVLLVAIGLYYTNAANRAQQEINQRQLQLALQGQITDRLTKTIEQLGAANPEVRLGAIYSLERIMRDSHDDQTAVVEILSAYVRTQANRVSSTVAATSSMKPGKPPAQPRLDVQSAISVLGRRDGRYDGRLRTVDISSTDLRGISLAGLNLAGVNLELADLTGSDARDAELAGANLRGVVLENANLEGANLSNAIIVDAVMRGANVSDANLTRAELSRTSMKGASLNGATLGDTDMRTVIGLTPEQIRCTKVDVSLLPRSARVAQTAGKDNCSENAIVLSAPSGSTGTKVTVNGYGFDPGEVVDIRFHVSTAGRTRADELGHISETVTVPSGYELFAPFSSDFVATGERSIRWATAPFRVTS